MENKRFEFSGADAPAKLEHERNVFDQTLAEHETDEARRNRAEYIVKELAGDEELPHDFAIGVAKFNEEVAFDQPYQRQHLVLPNGRTIDLYYNSNSDHVRLGYRDI